MTPRKLQWNTVENLWKVGPKSQQAAMSEPLRSPSCFLAVPRAFEFGPRRSRTMAASSHGRKLLPRVREAVVKLCRLEEAQQGAC